MRWVHDHWEVKDLGSRNGTMLDGVLLTPGTGSRLATGMKLAFGHVDQTWELVDDSRPHPMFVPEGAGDPWVIEGELAALPSQEEPQVTVFCGHDGAWKLEQDEGLRSLVDGDIVFLLGRNWRFSCPQNLGDTVLVDWTEGTRFALQDFRLCFGVSQDEEHVELALTRGEKALQLGSRSHNYLLLTLARHRVAETASGVDGTSSGWVHQDTLISDLKIDRERLNLDVFRIRKQFSAAGIRDAVSIIERRPAARQLRIGSGSLSINQL